MWRLAFAIVLLLISLLVLFKAPTNFFWRVQVAVTEFPYIPVFISLAFFVSCFSATRYKLPVLILSAAALLFYCLPILEVYLRGKHLEQDLSKNFPFEKKDNYLQNPFSLIKLFTGIGVKEREPELLIYKQVEKKNLVLDFYRSSSTKPSPCVIVIHGGSWAGGDSKQLPALNSYLSARGYHVAAINYRLAPGYKSPSQVEDTRDALLFLKKNCEKLLIDSNNFILLGRSAGAQIALVAAYTFKDPAIKGVVSFYGPADMVWGARIKSNKLVLNTDQVFRNYLGGLIDEVPAKYHEASSIDFVSKDSPATLLIHGPNDAMVSYFHSVRLSEKLEENKVPRYFLNLPWATHGCDYSINGPSGQISTFSIERFLNSVTKK